MLLIRTIKKTFGCLLILTSMLFSMTVSAEPLWKQTLIAFNQYEYGEGPWTKDEKIKDSFHEEHLDDLQVVFSATGKSDKNGLEVMWVSVLSFDKDSGTYLGKLLNQPNVLKSVRQEDNVIFKFDESTGMATAIAQGKSYWKAAVPEYATKGVGAKLYKGLREYRLGNFGHNKPEIEKCIKTLSKLTKKASKLKSEEDQFIAFFTLGRCAAEAYETQLAVESFKSALKYKPNDVDANMALLAEYSIAVYDPDIQPQSEWESAYTDQKAYLIDNFPTDKGVVSMLETIFNEKEIAKSTETTEEEKDYQRRFGLGVFRWKSK